ncbi:hypothetical protein F5B20DRAFT_580872 [Whalleya microplaca]|nr:hypothetical protein F5B20DRAFT_580872 [Whalleya microplaca]
MDAPWIPSVIEHWVINTPVGSASEQSPDITTLLSAFYTTKTTLSNRDCTRLATASGREYSDIGLIIHVASHDGRAAAFWDTNSPTIQLLRGKGLRDGMLNTQVTAVNHNSRQQV